MEAHSLRFFHDFTPRFDDIQGSTKLCSYVTQCTLEFAYLAGYPLFGDVWSPACSLAFIWWRHIRSDFSMILLPDLMISKVRQNHVPSLTCSMYSTEHDSVEPWISSNRGVKSWKNRSECASIRWKMLRQNHVPSLTCSMYLPRNTMGYWGGKLF
jgi:hypothetical protein